MTTRREEMGPTQNEWDVCGDSRDFNGAPLTVFISEWLQLLLRKRPWSFFSSSMNIKVECGNGCLIKEMIFDEFCSNQWRHQKKEKALFVNLPPEVPKAWITQSSLHPFIHVCTWCVVKIWLYHHFEALYNVREGHRSKSSLLYSLHARLVHVDVASSCY